MKTLLGFVLVLVTLGAWAQSPPVTPPIPDPSTIGTILANAPTVSLSQEKFGVGLGAAVRSGSLENAINVRYDLPAGFAVAGELQLGTANIVDSAGAQIQYRRILSDSLELYGLIGARRNWSSAKWEGLAGGGVSWMPAATATSLSFLGKSSLFLEGRAVIDSIKDRPGLEGLSGARWSF